MSTRRKALRPIANPGPGEPLLPELPRAALIDPPEEIDRLVVRLWPDGLVSFKGTGRRVGEFLHTCAELGLRVDVDHVSLCG
jgi:hypothetical protein